MTTLEPGARVVFTHGLRDSPLSTAFFASRAAPSMTCGLEVLVQDVMAAITTAPWSSSNSAPSDVTRTGLEARPPAPTAADSRSCGRSAGSSPVEAGGAPGGEGPAGPSSARPPGPLGGGPP